MTGPAIRGADFRRGRAADWRQRIGRDLAWLLAGKAVALGLLWYVFFSGTNRPDPDAAAASRHFALTMPTIVSPRDVHP